MVCAMMEEYNGSRSRLAVVQEECLTVIQGGIVYTLHLIDKSEYRDEFERHCRR